MKTMERGEAHPLAKPGKHGSDDVPRKAGLVSGSEASVFVTATRSTRPMMPASPEALAVSLPVPPALAPPPKPPPSWP